MKNSDMQSHEVGQKLPNELMIYDLSGNVWEWCWDWAGEYPEADQDNPTGPSSGQFRVIRGGSWSGRNSGDWISSSSYCEISWRDSYPPNSWKDFIGFRVVLPADPRQETMFKPKL